MGNVCTSRRQDLPFEPLGGHCAAHQARHFRESNEGGQSESVGVCAKHNSQPEMHTKACPQVELVDKDGLHRPLDGKPFCLTPTAPVFLVMMTAAYKSQEDANF